MMPVVKGAKSTRLQILLYSLALIPVCLAPAFTGLGGPFYLAVAAAGGAVFLVLAWRLFRSRAGDLVEGEDGLYAVKPDVSARPQPLRLLDPLSVRPVRRPAGRAQPGAGAMNPMVVGR